MENIFEGLQNLIGDDLGTRYKKAATIMYECQDEELADVLNTLSTQTDFDDNAEASKAIERTRQTLDGLIKIRRANNFDKIVRVLTDEEIIGISGGEVTDFDYDQVKSTYLPNGLFDPNIFGGSGKILVHSYKDKWSKHEADTFGKGMGHIDLACRVVAKSNYSAIAQLLNIAVDDINRIMHYDCYVIIESHTDEYKVGTVLTETEFQNIPDKTSVVVGMGGDAIYDMLKSLKYGFKPERLAFKILPVVAPAYRPVFYSSEEDRFVEHPLNERYRYVIDHSNNCKKLKDMEVPGSIIRSACGMLIKYVDMLYDELAEQLKKPLSNVSAKTNYTIAMRLRTFANNIEKGVKLSEIESLNLYPETIKIVFEDGNMRDITLERVINKCSDTIYDYKTKHVITLEAGEELTPEQELAIEHAEVHMEILREICADIFSGAKEQQNQFKVRFVNDLQMYVPA